MTVQPDIPHKVDQMRHDVDDLYELVSQNQARTTGMLMRHNNRLEELQQTLDLHSGRLGRIEDNQRQQAERLERVEGRLEGIGGQLAEILGVLRGSASGADSAPESPRQVR